MTFNYNKSGNKAAFYHFNHLKMRNPDKSSENNNPPVYPGGGGRSERNERNSETSKGIAKKASAERGLSAKHGVLKNTRDDGGYKKGLRKASRWCTRGESNPRHPASEAGALSN